MRRRWCTAAGSARVINHHAINAPDGCVAARPVNGRDSGPRAMLLQSRANPPRLLAVSWARSVLLIVSQQSLRSTGTGTRGRILR